MTELGDQMYMNAMIKTAVSQQELQKELQEGKRLAKQMANSLSMGNSRLKYRVEDLEEENENLKKTIIQQKTALRDWMISQVAFKNLFKQYGKLDDGTPIVDLSDAEKSKMIADAEDQAVMNDDYLKERIQKLNLK